MSNDLVFLSGNKIGAKNNNPPEDIEPTDNGVINTEPSELVIANPARITNPHIQDINPDMFNLPQHIEFTNKQKFLPIHETEDTLKKRIKEAERKLIEQREQEKMYLYKQRDMYTEEDHDEDTCAKINCRDISKHIATCPVCSNLYKCDKMLYLVFIIILIIIIAYLVRKMNSKLY